MATVSDVGSVDWDLARYTKTPSIYVLASQPRSGSHYLAALLRSTGSAGVPLEYFHPTHWKAWVERCDQYNPSSAFNRLCQFRTTPNGVFGVKMHWRQFAMACRLRLEPSFSHAGYVQLIRHDTLGQAISLVIASQTGSWIGGQRPTTEPEFSVPAIQKAIAQILSERSAWERFYSHTGLEPLRISYEGLVDDPDETMAKVCAHVGASWNGMPDDQLPPIQRSSRNEEWRQRFLDVLPTLHEEGCFWRGQFGGTP